MAGKGGIVQIPWYATVLRHHTFEDAIAEIAPVALKYGATAYSVTRNRDDRYKFLQSATFERYDDFTAYWEGPEFQEFRFRFGGWFQIPVLYSWNDDVCSGETRFADAASN
ncbi:MAG: hypothetical protein WCO96_00260 [Actinomycetes bacterium]